MRDSWTCLMVEKGPGLLDEYICADLKKAACAMTLNGFDSMRFKESVAAGRIETEWKHCVLGSRSGIIFRSEVEADTGEFRVNFLISMDDLKRGAEVLRAIEEGHQEQWIPANGQVPVPDLYDFSDLRAFPQYH